MKYFIGIVLAGETKRRFEQLRKEVCHISGSTRALDYPPHITLRIPFESEDDMGRLKDELEKYSSRIRGFEIMSTGIMYFEHAVCFLDVEQDPRLNELAEDMDDLTAKSVAIQRESLRRPTRHFHATLAFRDLTEEGYARIRTAEPMLVVPTLAIAVDHVALLRQEDGLWKVERTFPFGGRS